MIADGVTHVRLRILGESLVEVGDRIIGPDSPCLFALALYLGLAGGRPIHKAELCDLLFPDVGDRERASHNLRQLLYRLRRMGVDAQTIGDRVSLAERLVRSSFDAFVERPRAERAQCRPFDLAILPAYEPRISPQFSDWLEMVRIRERARVRALLQQDFAALEQSCDWDGAIALGRTLQDLQMATEDVVSGTAQALALRGRKQEALDVLDSFLADCDPSVAAALRQLRGRIARVEQYARVRQSAFYGRHMIMHELARQWDHAIHLAPQLAVIAGGAGIGKTRLSQEFGSYVRLHGGHCVHYACDRSDSARPYALFRTVLPQLRRMRGSLGASPTLQQHLDLLASEAISNGTPDPPAAEAMRAEIQRALIDLLEAVSAEKPLLIVVDDAHLQDAASRAVLSALIRSQVKAAVMVMCCNRTAGSDDLGWDTALQGQVHRLAPLSAYDSVAVLSDLLPDRRSDRERLCTWSSRAGGNPYYLHAMAYSLATENQHAPTTFDISRFAASTYYALTVDAKAVYEACVLLGPLATIPRLGRITEIDGARLVSALRELETTGMTRCEGATLRCAHSLLEEASSALIPQSVAAFLHSEIAASLEAECGEGLSPAALAWAAADHWIAIGDVKSAARLLQRCASQAAALGEPLTAAQTLEHIPTEKLEPRERAAVLSRLAEYAEAASDFKRALDALRAYQQVGCHFKDPDKALEIDFRIIESDLRHGADPAHLIPKLQDFITNRYASSELRVRAGTVLIIAADTSLDEDLARSTYKAVAPYLPTWPLDYQRHRIEIVFQTVFGDSGRALKSVDSLLEMYPTPTIENVSRRRNIGHALYRLGLVDLAREVLLADYDFMVDGRMPTEMSYRLMLLIEIAVRKGQLEEAQLWADRLTDILAAGPQYATALQGGYYSAVAELALLSHRWDEADAMVEKARAVYPAIGAARFSAIALSIQLRAQLGRNSRPAGDEMVPTLYRLYKRGQHLGTQDRIVEALWLAEVMRGRADLARSLLFDYLTVHRREIGPPIWSLTQTTSADPAWNAIAPPPTVR